MPNFSPRPIQIAPSLIAADFTDLRTDLARINGCADMLHVDIMDGHFVPNISFGPFIVKHVKGITNLPLDVHLMISEPKRYAHEFAEAGATNMTFHLEADGEGIDAIIEEIRAHKCTVGISIKPNTPFSAVVPWLGKIDRLLVMTVEPGFGGQKFMPDMIAKVRQAAEFREAYPDQAGFDIEVDGGLAESTIRLAVEAGAEVIVAGTAVFGASNPSFAIEKMRKAALG
jgi:ribulose-phosphate 3-epimerase